MTILEINGRRVEVPNTFNQLSPEQQAAQVDDIAATMGAQPQPAAAPAFTQSITPSADATTTPFDVAEQNLAGNVQVDPNRAAKDVFLGGRDERQITDEPGALDEVPPIAFAGPLSPMAAGLSFVERALSNLGSIGSQLGEGVRNEQLAALQGVTPIVRTAEGELNFPMLGRFVQTDAGFQVSEPDGSLRALDPEKEVVLIDPATGERTVFERTPETEEGGITSAARMFLPGFATNAPTNVATRGLTQIAGNPVARAVAGRNMVQRAQTGLAKATTADQQQQLLDDAARTGVTPNVPLIKNPSVTDSSTLALATQALARAPLSSGVVQRRLNQNVDEIATAAQNISEELGPGVQTVETAGRRIQEGIQNFRKGGGFEDVPDATALLMPARTVSAKRKSDALYNRVDDLVGPGSTVPMGNTRRAVEKIRSTFGVEALDKVFKSRGLEALAEALADIETLTWENARSLRTMVRELRGAGDDLAGGVKQSDIDLIRRGITDDLLAAAEAKGGPEAAKAMTRADKFYRTLTQRVESRLRKLFEAPSPESAFEKLANAAKSKASADLGKLRALKRSLPTDEFNDVAATLFQTLGKPTPSAADPLSSQPFSIATFVTNWSKLSDGAKDIMFGSGSNPVREQMDSLVRIAAARKSADRFTNTSNTANVGLMAAFLGGSVLEPTSAVATALSGMLGAKLLMSPKFLNVLMRRGTTGPRGTPADRNTMAQIFEQFRLVGQSDPELAGDIEQFIGRMEAQMGPAEAQAEQN